jgi:hypothetical protein
VSGVLQSTVEGSCIKDEQERSLLLDATNVRTEVDVVKSMEDESRVPSGFLLTRFKGHWSHGSGASRKRASGPGSLGAWEPGSLGAWSSALSQRHKSWGKWMNE